MGVICPHKTHCVIIQDIPVPGLGSREVPPPNFPSSPCLFNEPVAKATTWTPAHISTPEGVPPSNPSLCASRCRAQVRATEVSKGGMHRGE